MADVGVTVPTVVTTSTSQPKVGTNPLANAVALASQATKALDGLASNYTEMQIFDTYHVPVESLAIIECKNKGIKVVGIVVDQWQFNMESKWDSGAFGALSDSHILSTADTIAQDFLGASLHEPIFARKAWGGTEPFGTSIKLRFLAQESGLDDVYIPMIRLAALYIPRLLGSLDPALNGALGIFATPGPSPLGGLVIKDLLNALGIKASSDNFTGDYVSVKIGKLLNLENVYMTKMQGVFSKSLDSKGYPLAAEATLTFSSMDSPFFVEPDKIAKEDGWVDLEHNNVLFAKGAMKSALDSKDLMGIGERWASAGAAVAGKIGEVSVSVFNRFLEAMTHPRTLPNTKGGKPLSTGYQTGTQQ